MPSSRFFPLTLVLFGLAPSVFAQAELPVIHISDYLNGLEATRLALESGVQVDASKIDDAYAIGDSRTFVVYNHAESERRSALVLDDLAFTLMAEDDRFLIWVESRELDNGHVAAGDVDDLARALSGATPAGSIDPESGIIDNDERIFGNPPDVDGDDRTDVLLLDIRDGWQSGSKSGYVAGFVWSGDLSRSGNQRDVVYVDVNPGLYREGSHLTTVGLETTVAHEYQHLIHFNYDLKELTFVNEGLAEWASVMNGYRPRNISYLSDPAEHNVALLDWRKDDSVINDYQRAGLFTTYLAQRLGPEATGRIVRARRGSTVYSGTDGYRFIAEEYGFDFADLLSDFHLANFFNDPALGEPFAYELAARSNVRAEATFAYRSSGSETRNDFPFNAGSVQYFDWTDVSRLNFDLDISTTIPSSLVSSMRDRLRMTSVETSLDGATTIRRFDVDGSALHFEGAYRRITLALVHQEPDAKGVRLDMTADWSAASSVAVEDSELPGTVVLEQNYPNPFNPQTQIRYQTPRASHVRLSVYDALGRRVAVLIDGRQAAGSHAALLDASGLPSGTYLYVLETDTERQQKTMTIVR